MYNSRFHFLKGPFSLGVLAKICDGRVYDKHDPSLLIHGIGSLDSAKSGEITFIAIKKTSHKLFNTLASACIMEDYDPKIVPKSIACIISSDPHASYAKIAQKFHPQIPSNPEVSGNADISNSCIIGKKVKIESFTVISDGVVLKDFVEISSGVYIGPNVTVGARTKIFSGVSIECADIGDDVVIYSGVRIGQSGFGFAPTNKGHIKIPQVGQVVIGDNVEIGANCCIDRGSTNNTVIGDGSFLDNLVHVAHNVQIGKHCAIAGQVGIAGSAVIEDFCMFGGQVGIGGHVHIGKAVQAAGQTGITRNVKNGKRIAGTPAVSLTQYHRQAVKLKHLARGINEKSKD